MEHHVCQREAFRIAGEGGKQQHTRNDISSIHGVLVLDEAESVHQLDLGDLAGAMAGKVSLDVGLGSFGRGKRRSVSMKVWSTQLGRLRGNGRGEA